MCISPAILAGGTTVFKAVGQIAQGFAARSQGRADAAGDFQAAGQDLQRGVAQSAQRREAARKLLGSQRVSFAKGGVDLNSGTPLLVMAESAEQEELAAQTMMAGEQQRAQNRIQKGRVKRARGEQAFRQSFFSAGSELLLGAPKAFPETFGTGGG